MTKIEKIIKGLEICTDYTGVCLDCPYQKLDDDEIDCNNEMEMDALKLLKGIQPVLQPRLITESDFKLNADAAGYIPAWCEELDYDEELRIWTYDGYWECITVNALKYHKQGLTTYRYWTARPTDKQRKAVKWNE